jgi:phosphoribosylglycinamide formyltransferase-1
MLKLGWFSTGRDEAARNLLMEVWKRKERGELDIEIPFVFSNREPGEAPGTKQGAERDRFYDLVRQLGIDLVTVSHVKVEPHLRKMGLVETEDHSRPSHTLLKWRNVYGARVIDAIQEAGHEPDVCILAGYMLIWSEVECAQYDAINLHPALPWGPTGTWQQVIWELMAFGAKDQGVMMHLVTPELDRGPPVAYCSFPIVGDDWEPLWAPIRSENVNQIMRTEGEANALFRRIRAEGELRELPLIAHTVGQLASRRLVIQDKWPYLGGERLEKGADLSEMIEVEIS